MRKSEELPVAVIGAGPVGLAAAAHLIERGPAGEGLRGRPRRRRESARLGPCSRLHALALLRRCRGHGACCERQGWRLPPREALADRRRALSPAIWSRWPRRPSWRAVIETGARVTAISRQGIDKVVSRGRETQALRSRGRPSKDGLRRDLARAVIDASGTWTTPNPLGASGLPAEGEAALRRPDRLWHPGHPRPLPRTSMPGMTTLVVGAGHSAGQCAAGAGPARR